METKQCSEPNCALEVEYTCQCTSPETYLCKEHWMKHCELPNRDHIFEPIFLKPIEGTKEALLQFIEKEKFKKVKNKDKITSSFSKNLCNSEKSLEDLLQRLEFDSRELGSLFDKISQVRRISKFDQDSIIKLLTLEPNEAIENFKKIIPSNNHSYNNAKLVCGLSEDIGKMIESYIKDKFEDFLDKKLLNIEKILERHSKEIDSNKVIETNQIQNAMNSISNLLNETEKNKKEFEDYKQLAELKMQNGLNFLYNQLQDAELKIQNEIKLLDNQLEKLKKLLPDLQQHKISKKRSKILEMPNNPKLEQDFREASELFEKELSETRNSHPSLNQAYIDYIKAYHHKVSLYLIDEDSIAGKTNLFISDTENEIDEVKILDTWETLKHGTCIAPLPNGELFCFGNLPPSGITLIVNQNFEVVRLPYGASCGESSAIYFNGNVYCFGGRNGGLLNLAERFNLERNIWIKLNPLPRGDTNCNSLAFNGNILISGWANKNLVRYSIDSNTYTKIFYEFAESKRKILTKVERFYLIECGGGWVYESEIEDDTNWKQIAKSIISNSCPYQSFWTYNKNSIHIGINSLGKQYYKFNLKQNQWICLNEEKDWLSNNKNCSLW